MQRAALIESSVCIAMTHPAASDGGINAEPDFMDDSPGSAVGMNSDVADVIVDVESALLEPPTPALAAFDPFVKWLLSSSIEELTSIHQAPPFEVNDTQSRSWANDTKAVARRATRRFESKAEAEFARAEVEALYEEVADRLSMARREHGGIEDKVCDLEDERDGSRERIALLESRIVKHLQDRDLAIAEKYTTEKQIIEIEAWKALHPQRQSSSLLGFLKISERRGSAATTPTKNKDIERLQKEIADTKLETALAKTELDTHYYRLRQLEKKCVALKLEIAQASALEDDLTASLAQLRRERRSSLDKLRQVSQFSSSSPTSAKSARSPKSPKSPTKGGK